MLSATITRSADALPGFDIDYRRVTSAVFRTSYWRIAQHFDLEDAWQDAFWLFIRLRERYPTYEKPRMVRTYRTSLRNHMHDLSKRCSWGFGVPLSQFVIHDNNEDERMVESVSPMSLSGEVVGGTPAMLVIDRISSAIKEVMANKRPKLAR